MARNRWYDPNTGRFTQQDPIGFAGGINLYGYVGNNPVQFSDPFGLAPEKADSDTTWVGCRPLKGIAGAVGNHCAVATGENGSYKVGELLNNKGVNQVEPMGQVDALPGGHKWTMVPVPAGQTQQQFDSNVERSFGFHRTAYNGYSYSSHSLLNSNYFVFSVIRMSGGTIPQSAAPSGLTPGLCGGGGRFALGNQCSQ